MPKITFMLVAFLASFAKALNSTDYWPSVGELAIVQEIPECARSCVQYVNEEIAYDDDTQCESYGCVCAESTKGRNFVNGLSSVTECAKSSCALDDDVEAARTAFQDICVVYVASNSTPPAITQGNSGAKR
jgi:hypothetical protein